MSNWVDVRLDVLASSPEEINKIEAALQEPCEELIALVAHKWNADAKEIASDVKELLTFKPTHNLGYVHPSVNKARRFQNSFKDRSWEVVRSHVDFVSRDFPKAIFLAEHWNSMASSASKTVIRAGQEVRSVYDGSQQAQGYDWVIPDIFAPYRAEYANGAEFGTLWAEWMEAMRRQLAVLTERHGGNAQFGKHDVGDADPNSNVDSDDKITEWRNVKDGAMMIEVAEEVGLQP